MQNELALHNYTAPIMLLCSIGFMVPAWADDFADIHTVKAVWDVTTGNEKVFLDRMALIKTTAADLQKRGIRPDFVIVLRGKASRFATKSLKGTKFAKELIPDMNKAQSALRNLQKNGTQVEICSIAMRRANIKSDNVQPFAVIQKNVLENLIVLQNKGYAYMPVH